MSSIKKVFKSHVPSVNYVTQKGRTCIFTEGRFLTDNLEEIEELTKMVSDKSNPYIYIDPDDSEVDTTVQDRIRAAQIEATTKVLEEINREKQASGTQVNPASLSQASTLASQAKATMTPAQLLGIGGASGIAGMSAQSNQK